jgi:hypothetical protein
MSLQQNHKTANLFWWPLPIIGREGIGSQGSNAFEWSRLYNSAQCPLTGMMSGKSGKTASSRPSAITVHYHR